MTQEKAIKIMKRGENVFLTGQPGSGKSYTINLFRDHLDASSIPYAVTASTGIAATHIGGVTIHSWAGMGIKEEITQKDVFNIIDNKPFIVDKIIRTRVLIIDEVSMLSSQTLDNLDKILRGVRQMNLPFGGLQVIFVGDFFQLPPVSKNKKAEFAFKSKAWEDANLKYCYLHEQHRQSNEEFLTILNSIRNNEVTKEQKLRLMNCYNLPSIPKTQLFTHNIEVDSINMRELTKIDKPSRVFKMTSTGNEYLVGIMKKNCLSPEDLVLKVGAVVMFTRNKFTETTKEPIYVNGTIGTVVDFRGGRPIVETLNGEIIEVEQATWSMDKSNASITQFPLRLAWAVTIHKSQGMTLDCAKIDLSKAFEYGQGYVAVSRVKSMDNLLIEGINEMAFRLHPEVIEWDNIFKEGSDLLDTIL